MPPSISTLLVEDHAVTRQGLGAALGVAGDIDVVGQAESAEEGLRLCRELKPNVVLLDLHLPDSGAVPELIASFVELAPNVLIFTAEGRRAFVEAAQALPIAGYLLKSETVDKIAAAIRKVSAGERPVVSDALSFSNASLTPAEKSLLTLLAQGYKYESIGRMRNTSPTTVKKQCERLLIKLDLGTREELISWAALHGYGSIGASSD